MSQIVTCPGFLPELYVHRKYRWYIQLDKVIIVSDAVIQIGSILTKMGDVVNVFKRMIFIIDGHVRERILMFRSNFRTRYIIITAYITIIDCSFTTGHRLASTSEVGNTRRQRKKDYLFACLGIYFETATPIRIVGWLMCLHDVHLNVPPDASGRTAAWVWPVLYRKSATSEKCIIDWKRVCDSLTDYKCATCG